MAVSQIFNVVLGTAGHIDHGKSALVQALTGIHPDRLKEEQERGITIDLGFAPLELKNGTRVGIIDVPGHERFIKNMVAGASGIDFVIMVVAADDGIMAQTREHLQIIQLLGVKDGLTVITKKDLAEPDYLELVVEDVKALESGTVLEGKPIVAVSSKTGDGISELKALLEKALSKLSRRDSAGPFRMPIQRVFAKEGFGTVVTGVPLSGHIAVGDVLEVLPPGCQGRVKGLHAYKTAIEHGQAGHSTAVNLHGPDIDKREIVRGMVAVTPGILSPTKLLTAYLQHLSAAPRPLKHRAPVRFHTGTAEIQGKVLLLDGDALAPGASGWVQILLEEPTVLAPGDRFILRHQTPMVTLGGGRIADVAPHKRKRNDPAILEELEKRFGCLDDQKSFVAHILSFAELPKAMRELCNETALLPQQITAIMANLIDEKLVIALKPNEVFVSSGLLETLAKMLIVCVQAFLKEHPALGGVERPELKRRFDLAIRAGRDACGTTHFDDLLAVFNQHNIIRVESNLIALPGLERKLEGVLAATAKEVEDAIKAGALAPPAVSEILAQLKIQPRTLKEIIKFLADTGAVVEAASDIYFHRESYAKAKEALLQLFAKKPDLTASELRQHLGMNRKYVIPLLELFDRQKITVRAGDTRKLR